MKRGNYRFPKRKVVHAYRGGTQYECGLGTWLYDSPDVQTDDPVTCLKCLRSSRVGQQAAKKGGAV